MPEIVSAFEVMGMGDPFDFYDAIITAGTAFGRGKAGTVSELAMKPHPWLYAETARVGLGILRERKQGDWNGGFFRRRAFPAPLGFSGDRNRGRQY